LDRYPHSRQAPAEGFLARAPQASLHSHRAWRPLDREVAASDRCRVNSQGNRRAPAATSSLQVLLVRTPLLGGGLSGPSDGPDRELWLVDPS